MKNIEELYNYTLTDFTPTLSNEILDVLYDSQKIKSSSHTTFAYCYLGLLEYLKLNNKYCKFNYTVDNIKKMLGYSMSNRDLNYLIKKNGVLENLGLIENVKNPYPFYNTKNRIKQTTPSVIGITNHNFNIELLIKCISTNLGTTGFYICNFINEFFPNFSFGYVGHTKELYKQLAIPEKTAEKYLTKIKELKILDNDIFSRNSKGGVTDLNLHLRSYLVQWRDYWMNEYDGKCFITGETENLIIHHTVPFNKIRDLVLMSTKLPIKRFKEYSETEVQMLINEMIYMHEHIRGVPLTQEIHELFHKIYGYESDMVHLLEFRIKYLSGEL